MRLFCRAKDGGYPVDVTETGYVLHSPRGPLRFETKRSLLSHITNHPRGRNWSFSRYFGVPEDPTPVWNFPVVDSEPVRGIDLKKKYQDVKRIFFRGFQPQILALRGTGVDEEDLLQEVFLGILSRNQKNGSGKFDPTRSSFSHYVHLVARSKTSQIGKKQTRWGRETPIEEIETGAFQEPSQEPHALTQSLLGDFQIFLKKKGNPKLLQTLQGLQMGFSGSELASHLGLQIGETKRLIKQIRRLASEWDRNDLPPSHTNG